MNVLPKPPPEIVTEVFPDEVLPTPTSEIVAEVFQKKEQLGELVVESTPRTKGDIIRFSDTEDSESGDESIDVTDIQQNVNFLPATVEGLRKRFHELYTVFTQQGRHEHRNELVCSLG